MHTGELVHRHPFHFSQSLPVISLRGMLHNWLNSLDRVSLAAAQGKAIA